MNAIIRERLEALLRALDATPAAMLADRFNMTGEHAIRRHAGVWFALALVVRMTRTSAAAAGAEVLAEVESFTGDSTPCVLARVVAPEGSRSVDRMTCGELAELVRRDAEALERGVLEEAARAAAFYIEPHLRPLVLDDETIRLWPFDALSASRTEAGTVLDVLRRNGDARTVTATGLGATGLAGDVSHATAVQRWHLDVEPRGGRDGALVTWPLGEARDDDDPRWFQAVSGVGVAVLLRSRERARAALTGAPLDRPVVDALVSELASDSPWSRALWMAAAAQCVAAREDRLALADASRRAFCVSPLELDGSFLRAIRGLGATGRSHAQGIEEKAAERSARGVPLEFWVLLASGSDVVPRCAAAITRSVYDATRPIAAALARASHQQIIRMTSRATLSENSRGQQSLVYERDDVLDVATVPVAVLAVLERGAERLSSKASHLLIHYLVITGHDQKFAGNPDFREVSVPGGFSELADRLSLSKSDRTHLRAIAHAQQRFRGKAEDGTIINGLYSFSERGQEHGPRAGVAFVLGDAILPGFANQLKRDAKAQGDTPQKRRDRAAIPVCRVFAPVVGRPNEHAAQMSLQFHVMQFLRDHSEELLDAGTVAMPDEVWLDLAHRARVPPQMVSRVRDRWTRDDKDGAAFLSRNGDRFTLAATHAAELAMILEGARWQRDGAERGRRSAAAKAAKAQRRR